MRGRNLIAFDGCCNEHIMGFKQSMRGLAQYSLSDRTW